MPLLAAKPFVRTALALSLATATHAAAADGQASRIQRVASQPPVITVFALDNGAAVAARDTPMILAHTVVGAAPTEYRVSSRGDFAGATWQPYLVAATLARWDALTTPGCDVEGTTARLRLFLQVRTTLGDDVRIVNGQRTLVPVTVESNVVTDSICVAKRH
jgi:hypothetical protein